MYAVLQLYTKFSIDLDSTCLLQIFDVLNLVLQSALKYKKLRSIGTSILVLLRAPAAAA